MRRSAFTLIELLVVISIIAVLMGLLIPIIGMARKRARAAKCQALIAQVQSACELYRNANGCYPESNDDDQDGNPNEPEDQDRILTFRTNDIFGDGATPPGFKDFSAMTEPMWEAASRILSKQLQTVDRDHFDGNEIRDPFGDGGPGMVLRYRPASCYPYTAGAVTTTPPYTHPRIDSDNPPMPDSYQLWSAGPNGKDDAGEGDDLTNWAK